ncbi:VAN3-binding protein-like isoform X2 [Pyrus x bretschneideri]|uniref:VAN3-binding protein-like isoform X2 n=1 Tax=Pyrus x bretschneideri TaxID=225117 RepID=UPI0020303876|nr:VAN3-binding protein-like isoform X2 [Pyrus x bretschneideri]
MEELHRIVGAGKSVSFKAQQYQSTNTIPHSPIHAMEFLCRSWSSSAHNFQQMFTSTDVSPSHDRSSAKQDGQPDDKFSSGEPEDRKLATEEVINEFPLQRRTNMFSRGSWWGRKSLTSLLRQHRLKKKEDIRLHTASVHAALSVTRLAAAIASVAAAKNGIESVEVGDDGNPIIIGNVVASAAALVTAVCAEAAESLGAHTTHVSSAINSGLAIQTTGDMITLTAAAATSLRGAAALKARAIPDAYFPKNRNLLEVKAELSVVTPSGSRRYGWASVYSKHSQLILSIQKKHLGFLATRKEYKILRVMEGYKEAQGHGNFSICLRSNNGDIKLLFKDENQTLVWTSSISNLLQMHS